MLVSVCNETLRYYRKDAVLIQGLMRAATTERGRPACGGLPSPQSPASCKDMCCSLWCHNEASISRKSSFLQTIRLWNQDPRDTPVPFPLLPFRWEITSVLGNNNTCDSVSCFVIGLVGLQHVDPLLSQTGWVCETSPKKTQQRQWMHQRNHDQAERARVLL